MREEIRTNIDYDILCSEYHYSVGRIDGIVGLMADICCSTRPVLRVNCEDVPAYIVKDRLRHLDMSHICYVLDCLDQTTTKIGNIRAYTLSALYNAPMTIEQYYASQVYHDMAMGQAG